jgi:hypothetical protein
MAWNYNDDFYGINFSFWSKLPDSIRQTNSLPLGRIIGMQPPELLAIDARSLRYVGIGGAALFNLLAENGVLKPTEQPARFSPAVLRQTDAGQTIDLMLTGFAQAEIDGQTAYGAAVWALDDACDVALGLYDLDEQTLFAPPPQDFGPGSASEALPRAWRSRLPFSLTGRWAVPESGKY